jgi:hypothetical protein
MQATFIQTEYNILNTFYLQAYNWVQSLLPKPPSRRHVRQAVSPNLRIRKEYRRLTDMERANFHTAIQLLKADTVR